MSMGPSIEARDEAMEGLIHTGDGVALHYNQAGAGRITQQITHARPEIIETRQRLAFLHFLEIPITPGRKEPSRRQPSSSHQRRQLLSGLFGLGRRGPAPRR